MFEASLERDRTNAKTYLYLGYIYEIKQDYNSAVRVLSQGAVDASSMKEQIYFNLGNNYFKLADYNNAAAMYSKALQSVITSYSIHYTKLSVGSTNLLMHLSSVDFPEPDRPIITRNSPSSTLKLTFLSALVPSS